MPRNSRTSLRAAAAGAEQSDPSPPPQQQQQPQVEPQQPEEPETCVICLETLGDSPHALSCNHRFHASCLVDWFQTGNRACPTCRHRPPRTAGASSPYGYDDHDQLISEDSFSDEDYDGLPMRMPPAVRQRFSALEAEHNAAREEWYQREDLRCEANEKARATAITKALAASRARTAAKRKDAASKALVRSANKYRSASSRLVESRKEHETSAKKLRAAEKVYQKKLAGICKKHRESVRKEQKRHADSLAKLAEAMGKLGQGVCVPLLLFAN